jgi:plastocyanin
MDESKSILAQDATRPDTLVINKRLASTYELKNADGTTGKVISVPGIIVMAYPPKYIYIQPGSYITLPLT